MAVVQRRKIVDDFSLEEVSYLNENGAILYDGIEQTLDALKCRYNLYIVSNCQDGYVPAFLHAHKMESRFKDIEMSGRTGMDKGRNIKLLMGTEPHPPRRICRRYRRRWKRHPGMPASLSFGQNMALERLWRQTRSSVLLLTCLPWFPK